MIRKVNSNTGYFTSNNVSINTSVGCFFVYLSFTYKYTLKEQIPKRLCGLAVKISNCWPMELYKTFVQNKRGGLLFSFFIINQHRMTMLYHKKCVFKAIWKQMKYEYKKYVFSIVLLMLYYTIKYVCSKQARSCFLVY